MTRSMLAIRPDAPGDSKILSLSEQELRDHIASLSDDTEAHTEISGRTETATPRAHRWRLD